MPDEVAKLIAACGDCSPIDRRDAAIFAPLFSTGLRVHEACALERKDFQRDQLGKKPTFTLTVTGKGQHVRMVFFDERAQRLIVAMLADRTDHDPTLFVNYHPGYKQGGRAAIGPEVLSPRGMQLRFKVRAEQAGLADRKLTPHTMRHGLAVDLLESGGDLRTVQDVLGHRTIATTTIYTKLSNRLLEQGYLKRKSLQGKPRQMMLALPKSW
jgi:integrase/recombinase XerC